VSRVTVREAIVRWLSNGTIPFLSVVHGTPPKISNEGDWFIQVDPGTGTGAIICVHLESQTEIPLNYPVTDGGWRDRPYQVVLLVYLRSNKLDTNAIQNDNDMMIDALVERIEADPNFGDPSVVYQAGLGTPPYYGPDVRVETDLPRPILQQTTQIFSTIRFCLSEMVQPQSQPNTNP